MEENEKREPENFPLDESVIDFLDEVKRAMTELGKEADKLIAKQEGALTLFLRQHKLTGNWQVAPNGRELVKQPEVAAPVKS